MRPDGAIWRRAGRKQPLSSSHPECLRHPG
jgi:hypothetical protein